MTGFARIAYVLSALFAVWTIVLTVQMGGEKPEPGAPLIRGYETPILLLEFAGSEADLAFAEGEAGAPLRAELQRVQALDFWFPIAYAGLAAWCFLGLALMGRKLAWPGLVLAIATIPADWAENAVINTMLSQMDDGASAAASLPDLALATWIKWGLIAAYALVFALVLLVDRKRILAVPALAGGGVILATAVTRGSAVFAELIMLPLALFFLTILLTAMLYLRESFKAETRQNESPRQVES
jgi:preprotein translocase subunit SecG